MVGAPLSAPSVRTSIGSLDGSLKDAAGSPKSLTTAAERPTYPWSMDSSARASWLPEHQLHVLGTLAHIDSLIWQVGESHFGYVSPPGPLEFANSPDGERAHVTVKAIAPLPEAISRWTADALTQMRAAIEHTIYAEVEQELGQELNERQARAVEMPSCTDHVRFEQWLAGKGRRELPSFRRGTPLVERIERLQPYHRRDVDEHPLRVLVEHTNRVKHRTPAVAATRIGTVIPDQVHPDLEVHVIDRPLRPGDVLASAPVDLRVPISIWPTVSLQRPHTGTWHGLMHELGDLEEWVREVAIPVLTVGTRKLGQLPPQLDVTKGHADLRTALHKAGTVPAAKRAERRLAASLGREGLVDTLVLHPRRVAKEAIRAWVGSLDDDGVLDRLERLQTASTGGGLRSLARETEQLLDDVLVATNSPT